MDNLIYPNSVNTAPLATIEDCQKMVQKRNTNYEWNDCNKYFDVLKSKGFKWKLFMKTLIDGLMHLKFHLKIYFQN